MWKFVVVPGPQVPGAPFLAKRVLSLPAKCVRGLLHDVAAAFDVTNFTIHKQYEVPMHLLHVPAQQMPHVLAHYAIQARQQHASTKREAIKDIHELDHHVIRAIHHHRQGEDARIASYHATLGAHTSVRAHNMDNADSNMCIHCNTHPHTDDHLWVCTNYHICQARNEIKSDKFSS